MQKVIISGGLGRDSELKVTKAGEDVLTFPVGVSQYRNETKTTNWYRCTLFGKRGRSLKDYLLKGVKVVLDGKLEIGEYEGKTQLNVIVGEVEFMSRADNSRREPTEHDKAKQNGYQPDSLDSDLEDEVPF